MDIYYKKKRWKQILLVFAVFIGIVSLIYTNNLVKKVADEEQLKFDHWIEATKLVISEPNLDGDISSYLLKILSDNHTIPLIIVDENDEIISELNINYTVKNKDKVLRRELMKMKAHQEPIEIPQCVDLKPGEPCDKYQYLYYKESTLLVLIRYYPIFQFAMIILFIIAAYVAFSSARKSEQNLVWIGMAKETAHQLGTPISSLMAWVELLKDENVNPAIISELDKDAKRLEKITERFSKVGSVPELYPENLYLVLANTISYLQTRVSKKIQITSNFKEGQELYLPLSSALFSWVIENLIRNAVDAIEDKQGSIDFKVIDKDKEVHIEITDNGKGIPKSKFRTIFQPGFTTKKRGWGLGLSLSKRIIEIYHRGKISIKSSEPRKATTFLIVLKK